MSVTKHVVRSCDNHVESVVELTKHARGESCWAWEIYSVTLLLLGFQLALS